MPTMSEVIADHTELTEAEDAWLRLLVSDWQLLADLSFSDLVLWVPDRDPNVFWAAAQVRPTTGPTALIDDLVGDHIGYAPEHLVSEAFLSEAITATSDNKLQAGMPVDVHAIPVSRNGSVIGVVERHTNQLGVRTPGQLEQAYLRAAGQLAEMIARGQFPLPDLGSELSISPRVGDGFIRLDAGGEVSYASPNALSAYRRLGLYADLEGENLVELTVALMPPGRGPLSRSVLATLSGRAGRDGEVVAGDAHLLMRSVPLASAGSPVGAIVLCRDVTDVRSRERQLVTKNATIREIHHRVKNNLQTVAALLRMQARRIDSPAAKAALNDATLRVASIALVHDTLSQTFDEIVAFDVVADQILQRMADLGAPQGQVTTIREGSFGKVSATVATSLSLVVTELCQNAIEHGIPDGSGTVRVKPTSTDGRLRVEILDQGRGLPDGFSLAAASSLGLSIVSTLLDELGGTVRLGPNPSGAGTMAVVELPRADTPRMVSGHKRRA